MCLARVWVESMRITFVSSVYKKYGSGRYTFELSSALKALGNDVRVFVNTCEQPSKRWFTQIKPIKGLSRLSVHSSFLTAARINGESADVWHANDVGAGYACRLVRKKPLVVTLHDVAPLIMPKIISPVWRVFYKLWLSACKGAEAIVLVSECARRDAIKYANLDEEKVFAIYNGVDRSRFYPATAKERAVLDERKGIRIGYCGKTGFNKKVNRLIEAFALLNKKYRDLELVIAGAGKQSPALQRLSQSLNLANVHFLGFVPDEKLRAFYVSLDVYAHPSDYEGFGFPVVEAMACGVPIVAINRSAMPEVVGSAGLLTQPNAVDFAEALERLITNERLRKKKAMQGLRQAKKFNWFKSAKQYLKLYHLISSV